MTLTEFLLARIAEDEEYVSYVMNDQSGAPFGYYDPHKAGAECKAKRGVIAAALLAAEAVDDEGCNHTASDIGSETEPCRHVPPPLGNFVWRDRHPEPYTTHPIYSGCHGVPVARAILAPLAAVYSDHPDYLPEWRPTD